MQATANDAQCWPFVHALVIHSAFKKMQIVLDHGDQYMPFHLKAKSEDSLGPRQSDNNGMEHLSVRLFFCENKNEFGVLKRLKMELQLLNPSKVFAIGLLNMEKLPSVIGNPDIQCVHISYLHSSRAENWFLFLKWLNRWRNLHTLVICNFRCLRFQRKQTRYLMRCWLRNVYMRSSLMLSEGIASEDWGNRTRYLMCADRSLFSVHLDS